MKVLVMASEHRIFSMSVARVYPLYVAKLERKGRTQAELDVVIKWLTGYTAAGLAKVLKNETDFKTFFAKAPKMNPARFEIKGVICGVRVEEIEDKTMQSIRHLDKLVDELAKGKAMEKVLRTPTN
jgi:hypothetical protein